MTGVKLRFKRQISKEDFEEKVSEEYGKYSIVEHSEKAKYLVVVTFKYYKGDVLLGAWCNGLGWIFDREIIFVIKYKDDEGTYVYNHHNDDGEPIEPITPIRFTTYASAQQFLEDLDPLEHDRWVGIEGDTE